MRVFVSYAHESEQHKEDARRLAELLRCTGIDAVLDAWFEDERRNWHAWAEKEIGGSDYVLVLASPAYRRIAAGPVGVRDHRGLQAEIAVLREKLQDDQAGWLPRILPVILPGFTEDDVPEFLLPASCTRYTVADFTVEGVDRLLRTITRQPLYVPPALGEVPLLLPRPPVIPYVTRHDTATPWQPGDTVRVRREEFLIRGPLPGDERAADGSAVRREAFAQTVDTGALVHLRQVVVTGAGTARVSWRAEAEEEAVVLRTLDGIDGFPRLQAIEILDDRVTSVTSQPRASTWRQAYGPEKEPLDEYVARQLLYEASSLCRALGHLHQLRRAHRALTPDDVWILDGRMALSTIGLAARPPAVGEGPAEYRAPEQERLTGASEPVGRRTDIYRLAAMLHHTLTGTRPGRSPVPVTAAIPRLPARVDEVIRAGLARRPSDRPVSMAVFAAGLRVL